MKDWLRENWKTFARVAFVGAAYVFVRTYPLAPEQREDLMMFVVVSGIWAGLAPGLRRSRREDDEQ